MRLLWSFLRRYKGTLTGAIILAIINTVFSLLDPLIFRKVIDDYGVKAGTIPVDAFVKGVLWLLFLSWLVVLVSRVAKNFQDYYVNVVTQNVGAELYSTSVAHSFSLPYTVFEDQRSGELLQKLQKARNDSQQLIANFVNQILLALVGIIFVLVYGFTINWMIGLGFFLIIPILGTVTYLISRKIKVAQKTIVAQTAELAGSTTETLRNVELVKSLGLEEQEIGRLNDVNSAILALELKKIRYIRVFSFIQGTLVNLLRTALTLLMFWMIARGDISLGEFFSLLFYSFFVFEPLGQLGNFFAQYQETQASLEQLGAILAQKPEEKPVNPATIGPLTTLAFEDVSFTYPSATTSALANVNLKVSGGETIAFVGPSGSGKSTLVKLLVGLYHPTGGHLRVNGTDSAHVDFEDIRRRIGLVTQETQLFAGTIRSNLLFVNPQATDEECLEVLRQAAALPIIERGGKGLDTKIGEGGIKISGGERQRLAIARALLRNPELLIFDEATSSLDSITEKAISATIEDITRQRPNTMTVLVAHRLSTIAKAERIYVLAKGQIEESGGHDELIEKNGLYAALWKEQQARGEHHALAAK